MLDAERTVEIKLAEGFRDRAGTTKEVDAAVGYLATWAAHGGRRPKVRIHGDAEGCLEATYFDAQGNVTYVIFGKFEDGSYTFHS